MRTLITFTFVLLATMLYAQDDASEVAEYQRKLKEQFKKESLWYRTFNRYEINPGFSSYSLGYARSAPLMGWDDISKPFGIRYRVRHIELGFTRWEGLDMQADTQRTGVRVAAGYHTPVGLFRIGKRSMDVRGFLLQPVMGGGYTNTAGKHGAYVSPGIHLQLPFVIIGLRANTEYTFGGGFNVFPEVNVQLDALATLLDPQLVRTGTYNSSSTRAEPLGGGWYKVTHTEYATPFYIKNIGPIWAVTPRFGYSVAPQLDKPYTTKGLGISGRLNYFGADIHIDKGKLVTGVTPNANALDGTVRSQFDNERVVGTINTTELTLEGSFNLVGLFLTIFKKNAISKMGSDATQLNRLHFNLGMTYMTPGKVNLAQPDSAAAYTDRFFADNPDVERNAINDPLQHKKEWGVTYGLSLELGAVGVRVNNKLSKTMGKGSSVEVYYLLPVTKILKAYK